ncbi:hypothetical protein B0H34DRAFT_385354 [Crassisporium funariophilum]|nr:hypothetical protein B0H34DRAFT_385354 [Crassisporium funariophilum]
MFSVARFIGKSRTRSTKRIPETEPSISVTVEKEKHSVDSNSSTIAVEPSKEEALKAESSTNTVLEKENHSSASLPAVSIAQETENIDERKVETHEEPSYAVVSQPQAKTSEVEWTDIEDNDKPKVDGGVNDKAFSFYDAGDDKMYVGTNKSEALEEELRKAMEEKETLAGQVREVEAALCNVKNELKARDSDKEAHEEELRLVKGEKEYHVEKVRKLEVALQSAESKLKEKDNDKDAHKKELREVHGEKEIYVKRIREVEGALRSTQEALKDKNHTIAGLASDIDRKNVEVERIKAEKEEMLISLEEERRVHSEQIRVLLTATKEAERTVKDLKHGREEVASELEAVKEELRMAEEQLKDKTAEVMSREEDLAELQAEYEDSWEQLTTERNRWAERDSRVDMLELDNKTLTAQLLHLQAREEATHRQNGMAMEQMRQQSDELQAILKSGPLSSLGRTFRRATATSTMEQAVRTIKVLNTEIFQTAATLTGCVDGVYKRFVTSDTSGNAGAEAALKSVLGTDMLLELKNESKLGSEDYGPFILQSAFQGCLIACCMRNITSWYPADHDYGTFLEVLYERVRGSG